MPPEVVIKIVGCGLIWLFFLLVLILLLLSQAKEFGYGQPMRYLMPFAAGILALCAMIVLAIASVRAHRGNEMQFRISRANVWERGVFK